MKALRATCEVCHKDVATAVPHMGDGTTLRVRKHTFQQQHCNGSHREVDLADCREPREKAS